MLTPDELAAIRAHFAKYANEVRSDDALRLCAEITRLRGGIEKLAEEKVVLTAEEAALVLGWYNFAFNGGISGNMAPEEIALAAKLRVAADDPR